jgi:protein-tyrosine phosphatase
VAQKAAGRAALRRLRDFDPEANGDLDVPDPWYGGAREFARVHDIIERCCRQLLTELRALHSI